MNYEKVRWRWNPIMKWKKEKSLKGLIYFYLFEHTVTYRAISDCCFQDTGPFPTKVEGFFEILTFFFEILTAKWELHDLQLWGSKTHSYLNLGYCLSLRARWVNLCPMTPTKAAPKWSLWLLVAFSIIILIFSVPVVRNSSWAWGSFVFPMKLLCGLGPWLWS